MDKLLIIDGNSLLSESYFGTLPIQMKNERDKTKWHLWYHELMCNKEGIYTNGIYAAVNRLEKILNTHHFSHVAFVFDVSRDTFRKKLYPEYKANREDSDITFKIQKDIFPQMLSDMGFPVLTSREYEGDDLIGSLVARFKGQIPITILSGDKDMTQLVDDGVILWYSCKKNQKAEEMYEDYTQGESGMTLSQYHLPDKVFPVTKAAVEFMMGVSASQVPDLKAIAGDSSDNYPGITGIGEKGALALLSYFGSLHGIYDYLEKLDLSDKKIIKELKDDFKTKTGSSLPLSRLTAENAKKDGMFFLRIATIFTGIQYQFRLDNLRLSVNQEARLNWYNRLEFYSILRRTS